jgi:hypothetical protein
MVFCVAEPRRIAKTAPDCRAYDGSQARFGACSNRSEIMKRLTPWDLSYGINMMIACAISYAAITELLVRFVDEPTKLLGGMWAVVATVFVFRESRFIRRIGSPHHDMCQLCAVPCLYFDFSGYRPGNRACHRTGYNRDDAAQSTRGYRHDRNYDGCSTGRRSDESGTSLATAIFAISRHRGRHCGGCFVQVVCFLRVLLKCRNVCSITDLKARFMDAPLEIDQSLRWSSSPR